MIELSWTDIQKRAKKLVNEIILSWNVPTPTKGTPTSFVKAYPVPRGGIHATQAIQAEFFGEHPHLMTDGTFTGGGLEIVECPDQADIIIDDIIDTGKTRKGFRSRFPEKPFFALVDKTHLDSHLEQEWVQFPWERMTGEQGPEENIVRTLEFIGEDPSREGLKDTPKRVVKSYGELFAGYNQNVENIFTTFEDDSTDEMVVLRDIEFQSTCEHHMLPFLGTASIAYIPNGKIIGISKLARLLEIFSRRLQIQERICQQITDALDLHLGCLGSGCVMKAQHLCMVSRGVKKQNATMITSSLSGVFRQPEVRAEFLSLIGS
jgi:GTP cyclohydrolase I